jgi:hypothetical protein
MYLNKVFDGFDNRVFHDKKNCSKMATKMGIKM